MAEAATIGPPYKKPPITEAVIEFRFSGPGLDEKAIERIAKKYSSDYPLPPQKTLMVDINLRH